MAYTRHVTIGDGALANTKFADASPVHRYRGMKSIQSPCPVRMPRSDQAARNVARGGLALSESGIELTKMPSMGFYVLAPESQIASGVFAWRNE